MKRQTKSWGSLPIFLLAILMGLAGAGPVVFAAGPYGCNVKIMPLGDSITDGAAGSTDDTGYRRSLHMQLTAWGDTVDFVGSQTSGIPVDFDRDHEGHGGWYADRSGLDDILGRVYGWLEGQDGAADDEPVDIVLLHIGTNDISGGQDAASLAGEVDAILDEIDRYESDYNTEITVVLARIVNRADPLDIRSARTTAYNGLLQTMADARIAGGDEIIVVDMEAALSYPGDMADNVHPDDGGYGNMADVWFGALDVFLPCFCPSSGDLPSPAGTPIFPPDGATGVSVNADLNWTAGCGATLHDVYFGTSNPPDLVQSDHSRTTYDPGPLTGTTTYYWRIDEINSSGTTAGTVSSFTTGGGPTGPRITDGLVALYRFEQGDDPAMVYDVSGVEPALDLTIDDPVSASWLADGGIDISSDTIIASSGPATKIIAGCTASNEITIEAWVKPDTAVQSGPARIATLSADTSYRNFTLAQDAGEYDVRLRTTTTSTNGIPSLKTSGGALDTQLQHIAYTRTAAGARTIYLDGSPAAVGSVTGTFDTWDGTFSFALANELTGDRPWLGEIHLVAVYERALIQAEVEQNYNAGPHPKETLVGDFDGDGDVDAFDLSIMIVAYGSGVGDPNFNKQCDLVDNDAIDAADLGIFSGMYGTVP